MVFPNRLFKLIVFAVILLNVQVLQFHYVTALSWMLLADSASTPLSKQPVCQENQFLAIYPRVVSGISVRIASTFGLTCAPLILTSPFVLRLLQQSPGKRGFTSLQEKGVMRSTSYKCFHDFFSHHEGLCATSCDLKLSIQREVRMTKFNGIRFCRCPLL